MKKGLSIKDTNKRTQRIYKLSHEMFKKLQLGYGVEVAKKVLLLFGVLFYCRKFGEVITCPYSFERLEEAVKEPLSVFWDESLYSIIEHEGLFDVYYKNCEGFEDIELFSWYEWVLGFCARKGIKSTGEFYTPSSVVSLMCELLLSDCCVNSMEGKEDFNVEKYNENGDFVGYGDFTTLGMGKLGKGALFDSYTLDYSKTKSSYERYHSKSIHLYDPTCGGLSILKCAHDYLLKNHNQHSKLFGQEISTESYAIAKIVSYF